MGIVERCPWLKVEKTRLTPAISLGERKVDVFAPPSGGSSPSDIVLFHNCPTGLHIEAFFTPVGTAEPRDGTKALWERPTYHTDLLLL